MVGLTSPAQVAMDRSAIGPRWALSAGVAPWRLLSIAAVLAATAGAALVARVSVIGGPSAAPAVRSAGSSHSEFLSLPVAAEGPVSRVLGAANPAYRVSAAGAGFQATSSAERLHIVFHRSGVLVSSGTARVGLTLRAAGSGNELRAVGRAAPRASANRVLYAHPRVEEWYANGPLGLEQGFTLPRALSSNTTAPLTLSLALSGDVHASLAPGRQSITFTGAPAFVGARPSSLRYGGLIATDARGRKLPSWLDLQRGRLLLRVDVRAAVYPLRIDPLIQQTKLTAADPNSGYFGSSVALSADGNTALVGAPSVKNLGGTAWVFTRSGSTWTQQGPMLTGEEVQEPEGGEAGGESCEAGEEGECGFGRSVSLSADGNTALVGAPRAEGHRGAAWVFTRSGSTWTAQGQKLTGGEEPGAGRFGHSVALSADGSTALIGGPADKNSHGAAWVFTHTGSAWTQQGPMLTLSGKAPNIHFGASVALSADGGTALIGGPGWESGKGATWVFTRSGSAWSEQQTLTGGETSGFGSSAALSGDGNTALIGSRGEADGAGTAWVFTRSGSAWARQGERLTGEEEQGQGEFGASVALSADGNTALIGGPGDNAKQGASWLFARTGSTWAPQGVKRVAREESRHGWFGSSVALSEAGATALVGGPRDNGKAGGAWVFVTASHEEETPHEEEVHKQEEQRRIETEQARAGSGASSGAGAGVGVGYTAAGGSDAALAFGPLAGSGVCKVALINKSIAVQSHSRATLKLRRMAGTGGCSGTLRLTVKTKIAKHRTRTSTIGTGRFSIAPGKVQIFPVKLNATARALLKARHGQLGASLVIRLSPGPPRAQTASVHLALQKAHASAH
jgi:hypothetical protein